MALLDKQHPLHADLQPLRMLLHYSDWQDAANGRLEKLADTLTRRSRWLVWLSASIAGMSADSVIHHLIDAARARHPLDLMWVVTPSLVAVSCTRYFFWLYPQVVATIGRLRALAARPPTQPIEGSE